MEEACIAATDDPHLHGVFFNQAVSRRDHVLVYVIRDFQVIEAKRPDREIAEAGFFPLNGLPDEVTRATRERIEEIVSGRTPSSRW